jgi:hypothetical protein
MNENKVVTVVVINYAALVISDEANVCTIIGSTNGGSEWAVVSKAEGDVAKRHALDYGREDRFSHALRVGVSTMLNCSEASDDVWSLEEAIIDEFKSAKSRVFKCTFTGLNWEVASVVESDGPEYVGALKSAVVGVMKRSGGGNAN